MGAGSRSHRWLGPLGPSVLAMVTLCGCHAMPLSRLEDSPLGPKSLAQVGRAALFPATVAMDPPSEMSSFEPVVAMTTKVTPVSDSATPATPLLDAALQKAKTEAIPPPPSQPEMSSPTEPPQPRPASLFANPLPIELPSVVNRQNEANKPEAARSEPAKPAEPAAKTETAAPEPEPARPEVVWSDLIRKLYGISRTQMEQSGGSPGPWMLRTKLLTWMAEPDLSPDFQRAELDDLKTVLKALDEPPMDASQRGELVRGAVAVLEDRAPLEITDLKLCSRIDKFSDYKAIDPPVRRLGDPVGIYCEIDGLRAETTSTGFRTRLAGQIEIVPEAGGSPVFVATPKPIEEVCRKRRRDYYVAFKIDVPRELPPGEYRVRLTVRDLTSDHSATRDTALHVIKE